MKVVDMLYCTFVKLSVGRGLAVRVHDFWALSCISCHLIGCTVHWYDADYKENVFITPVCVGQNLPFYVNAMLAEWIITYLWPSPIQHSSTDAPQGKGTNLTLRRSPLLTHFTARCSSCSGLDWAISVLGSAKPLGNVIWIIAACFRYCCCPCVWVCSMEVCLNAHLSLCGSYVCTSISLVCVCKVCSFL